MTDIERYELIRPILLKEKTVAEVHLKTGLSTRTLYRYLKRFAEQGICGLADKSHAVKSHPHRFTESQKEIVVQYKLENPQLSARQIAKHLTESGRLKISYHSVTNVLHAKGIALSFFPSRPRAL
jgi:transposase